MTWALIRLFSLLFCILLLGCDKDDKDIAVVDENSNDTSQDGGGGFSSSLIIDDSDLANLPKDDGGEHIAIERKDTEAPYGYYIYKPQHYTEEGSEYPLLIFLHGWSPNLGNEPLQNVLTGGPPRLIRAKLWDPKYPFLVVSPQLKSSYWSSATIHKFIEYLMETYQVNRDRIYLTGLSLGGGGCWYYVGEIDDHYAAAIVPISASGNPGLVDNLSKVPIWAFHGGKDATVPAYEKYGSVPLVLAINNNNPATRARVTVYKDIGHNAWTMTYNGSGTAYANQRYDTFDMDIYEWMLAYKKSDQDK